MEYMWNKLALRGRGSKQLGRDCVTATMVNDVISGWKFEVSQIMIFMEIKLL